MSLEMPTPETVTPSPEAAPAPAGKAKDMSPAQYEAHENDLLSKAYDKAVAADDDEPGDPAEALAKAERDPETGKFKAKLPEGAKADAPADDADEQDAEAEEAEGSKDQKALAPKTDKAKADAVEAPKHWSPKVRSEFAKLDPEAQRELAKESTEMRQALSRQGRALKDVEPVAKVLKDNEALFKAAGVNYEQGVAALLRAQTALANPNTAKDALLTLARNYNIDLTSLQQQDEDQDWIDPNVNLLKGEVQELKGRLAQYERHTAETIQQQRQASILDTINQFAADKPDFEEMGDGLVERILMLARANPNVALPDVMARAYNEQRTLDPRYQDKLISEAMERKAKAAEKARKASQMNVRSSDKSGRMSEDERLSAAYDRAMSA